MGFIPKKRTGGFAVEIVALARARVEPEALAAQRSAGIGALKAALDEQAREATNLVSQLEALTKAHDEQAALADQRAAEIAILAKARDEQAAVAQERREAAERAEKLLRLCRADLENLRQKYGTLVDLLEARQALLGRLRSSLNAALRLLGETVWSEATAQKTLSKLKRGHFSKRERNDRRLDDT